MQTSVARLAQELNHSGVPETGHCDIGIMWASVAATERLLNFFSACGHPVVQRNILLMRGAVQRMLSARAQILMATICGGMGLIRGWNLRLQLRKRVIYSAHRASRLLFYACTLPITENIRRYCFWIIRSLHPNSAAASSKLGVDTGESKRKRRKLTTNLADKPCSVSAIDNAVIVAQRKRQHFAPFNVQRIVSRLWAQLNARHA